MNKPFIVAEMSCNHLGSYERAVEIVKAAAEAGADGIKFQVWKQDTMCIDPAYTLKHGPWAGRTLVDLYREAYTPWEWLPSLFGIADALRLVPFASPFDRESVDYLEHLRCPIYKIASFELVDLPLIKYVASKGKPLMISTGMATEEEIGRAIIAAMIGGMHDITLLKCTSAYPANALDANLATLANMAQPGIATGISDHSTGIGVAVAAATLGAAVIEKHLTLSRADGGPDAGFSMEPHEFAQMVTECRRAVAAIGEVKYGCGPNESTGLRRSLWIAKDIEAGEQITADHVCTARPALGLPPARMQEVIGRTAARSAKRGTPITEDLLS